MNTKVLEDIGLTQGEIKVYLALLEEGECSAGKILNQANIQNSVFHFNINRLIEKGLVSYFKKGKFRVYRAANPKQFSLYLKDKQKQVEQLLPELEKRRKQIKQKQDTQIFEGFKGIIVMLNEFILSAKRGDEFLFFSADIEEKNEDIQTFYKRYDAKREEKGIICKGISPIHLKNLFKGRGFKMKYASFPVPANMGFFQDKMVIISWGDKPKGVLIESKEIVHKQKEFFLSLWNTL